MSVLLFPGVMYTEKSQPSFHVSRCMKVLEFDSINLLRVTVIVLYQYRWFVYVHTCSHVGVCI